ncbi:LruC domain-containing protein [Arcticibacter pallidicorallinus]|uniref:LruC domain-containing protein n=2 Tax=Arcticibacter pallidicorallinus TaxID=1259464 RepID=A0A2T0U384_9SPHI|nr:LruC domain-containing protein [Arcticibacter pallidicorallinus]
MFMKRFFLLAVSVLTLTAVSCKKDSVTEGDSGSTGEITVPASFNWGTSRDVSFSISITDSRFANKIHVVSIYAGNPEAGGELLSKGSATLTSSFNTKIYLPTALSEVYIVKTAPDGSKVINKATITSSEVSLALGATSVAASMRTLSATGFQTAAVPETSPACASGAGVTTITSFSSDFNAQNNGTYSVTASDVTLKIGWGPHNGTLYICGKNVKLSGGTLNGLNVIITDAGSATIEGTQWNTAASIKNFGTLTMKGGQWNTQIVGTLYNVGTLTAEYFTIKNGVGTNYGTITSNKGIWVDVQSSFTNHGTVNSLGTFNAENGGRVFNHSIFKIAGVFTIGARPSTFENYGTFTSSTGNIVMNSDAVIKNSGTFTAESSHLEFAGDFTNNTGEVKVKSLTAQSGTFTNRCKLTVLTDFSLNGATMKNESFIDVKGNTNMTSNMTLTAQAMFKTNNLLGTTNTVSGPADGTEWALFRVTGTSADAVNDAGGIFTGRVLYCDSKRTLDARHFSNSAKSGCDVYIPATECSEGYGVDPNPSLPDTDKDGVIDVEDDYPTDPTRAYKNRQINYNNGGSTIAFEDKWPYQGDYDMNDVVISYRYEIGTSAANQVVSVDANFKLIATGGEYKNGAGIQFNIPKDNLVSITGAAAEANQDSLVIILFNNSRDEQSNWNTSATTIADSKEYTVAFRIKNGPTIEKFGVGNYNLFIWNNTGGFGRGYETHLPGHQPTKLADRALFGLGDDNTTAGKPYYSKSGMTWALEIPISNFAYPIEKADITLAYRKFADWARSGGKVETEWYKKTSSDYLNQELIFKK